MKSTKTFKSITLIALLGAALAAPVLAQGGPGMGGGMGGGPGMQNGGQGMCARMDGGRCMKNSGPGSRAKGQGARGGRGMQFNQGNTPGWSLMTPEERTANQAKMRAVKTYDECKVAQVEHRGLMEARAKEKGVTLQAPRQNGCDNMKARGFIK